MLYVCNGHYAYYINVYLHKVSYTNNIQDVMLKLYIISIFVLFISLSWVYNMYICILDIKYTSNIHDVMLKLDLIQYICQMYNMHIF